MATNYYFRVSTVLAAVVLAAMVAMLVAYGTASPQIMPGATITANTLEDQTTPSLNDGKCSLREAIRNANNNQSSSIDCLAGTAGDARDAINFAKGLSG